MKAKETVRNPKTGETFPGKNHGVVKFKPGKDLKKIASYDDSYLFDKII